MANEEQLALLKQGVEAWNKWKHEAAGVEIDLQGADLEGVQLAGIDLAGAHLARANFSRACLDRANLSGAQLEHANFSHASVPEGNFTRANLNDANLTFTRLNEAVFLFASLQRADFRGAHLYRASLEDSDLRGANLSHSHLEKALLSSANCKDASMVSAHLKGANLTAVNFQNVNVSGVKYDRRVLWTVVSKNLFKPRSLWRHRYDIILNTALRCKGIDGASCFGSQRFRMFLQNQDYLEELLETRGGKMVCTVWWLFADCGKSLGRWASWAFLIAFLFAILFYSMGTDHFHSANLRFNFLTMFYYSVVTFTTLGFGDIAPRTNVASIFIGLEVIIGYVMLGGLIAIFAGKLARRNS